MQKETLKVGFPRLEVWELTLKLSDYDSGFTWTENGWQGPQINPKELADIPIGPDGNNSYSGLDPITEEDIQEFDDIFDITAIEFQEKAKNSNSTPISNVEEETKGVIKGCVDIAGYNKMVKIDGEYYIHSPNDAIVVSDAENIAASPVSINKERYFDSGRWNTYSQSGSKGILPGSQ